MEKDILKKYKAKAKDSFNTKWKLFLFKHVINKCNSDKLTLVEFSSFEIDDKLVQIYSAEYWQKEREDNINELKIDDIYKTLKELDERSKIKDDCQFDYIKKFEIIFPYTEFVKLINEKECSY